MARPSRTGMRIINPGSLPISADIVFVHGLQGDLIETWSLKASGADIKSSFNRLNPFRSFGRSRSEDRTESSSTTSTTAPASAFWPGDFLSSDFPHVRLLTFGYSSDIYATFRAVSQNNITQHAQNLIGDLLGEREDINRPIIFVCHSLGGIVVKEALRLSQGAKYQPRQRRIYDHTYGVVFFGTPHRGSPWAPWARIATNLTKLALQAPQTSVLQALQVDSIHLQIIADEFSKMIREDIHIHSFREEKGMSGLYGLDAKVVDDFSSIIGDAAEGQEGIDGNHTQMCKFSGRDDPGYKKVLRVLRGFVSDANSNSSAVADEDLVENGLSKLGRTLQQKLELDKAYNKLRTSGSPPNVFLEMPILRARAFDASTEDMPSVPSKGFGSCAFELAHVLQLLPGQSRFDLLELETTSLQELYHDSETYYCKCSREGLLRFVTQHFVSIRESSGKLLIQTDVGHFTLIPTDRRLLVRVNASERSVDVVAPQNQDYAALKKCAAGLWLTRQGDEISWTGGVSLTPGSGRQWAGPFDVSTLLLRQDIEHNNCLYFIEEQNYSEIRFNKQCAEKIGEALLWLYETRKQIFSRMAESFNLFTLMSQKRIISKAALNLVTMATKLMLSDAIGMRRTSPPTNDASEEERQIPEAERTTFVFGSSRLYDTLVEEYRANPSSVHLQTRLISALEEDPSLVSGQLAMSLLYRGNAEFILHQAISAPRLWLDILLVAEDDIYVG